MYNILCIIQNFPTLHSEKLKNISQKFINSTKLPFKIKKKSKNRTHIKVKLLLLNMENIKCDVIKSKYPMQNQIQFFLIGL